LLTNDLRVFALSPPACYEDNSCTAKEVCEFENLSKNWPEPTGYYQNCETLDEPQSPSISTQDSENAPSNIWQKLLIGGSISVVLAIVVLTTIWKLKRNKK
jgi:hypothetical protein